MLLLCWATVCDAGPTLQQHWVNVSCLPGGWDHPSTIWAYQCHVITYRWRHTRLPVTGDRYRHPPPRRPWSDWATCGCGWKPGRRRPRARQWRKWHCWENKCRTWQSHSLACNKCTSHLWHWKYTMILYCRAKTNSRNCQLSKLQVCRALYCHAEPKLSIGLYAYFQSN